MQVMGSPTEYLSILLQDKKYLITGVTEIDKVWEQVLPFIEAPLTYNNGEFEAEDIYKALIEKKMQLWVAFNDRIRAAMVTEVVNYPRKKIVRIVTLGGENMMGWIDDGVNLLKRWAKTQGATGLEVIGRKGWIRTLDKLGFIHTHVVLKKEI